MAILQLDELIVKNLHLDKICSLKDNLNLCHKFSLKLIKKGDKIVKTGEVIGVATADINKGNHVHIHNIKSLRG